jgi:hypothetical protein
MPGAGVRIHDQVHRHLGGGVGGLLRPVVVAGGVPRDHLGDELDVPVTPAALGVLPGVLRERHDVGREAVEMTGVVDADV